MVTGCVSISTFASLVGVPVAITGSSVGLTLGVKKYKKNIKKNRKGYDKIVLLAKRFRFRKYNVCVI